MQKTQSSPYYSAEFQSHYSSKPQYTNLTDNLRANFVQKVFGIVSVQLLATAIMGYMTLTQKSFVKFQYANQSLLLITSIIAIITMLVLSFSSLSKKTPINYILLGIFTLCEAYSISFITSLYEEKTVIMAFFLTGAVSFALTAYAFTTKKDIGYFTGIIITLSTAMLATLFGSLFIGGTVLSGFISIISAILSGVYLIYDVKALLGNNRRKVDIDDYIKGAMMIYMDIIRIFLKILECLNSLEKKDKRKQKERKKRRREEKERGKERKGQMKGKKQVRKGIDMCFLYQDRLNKDKLRYSMLLCNKKSDFIVFYGDSEGLCGIYEKYM